MTFALKSARVRGLDLHAAIVVPAEARERLERLCRYALRPAVGQERLRRIGLRTTLREVFSEVAAVGYGTGGSDRGRNVVRPALTTDYRRGLRVALRRRNEMEKGKDSMKVLVYGMQSSGATTFALLLAQRPNTISVLDLYCSCRAPALTEEATKHDVVVKCTVSAMHTWDEQVSAFAPDITILFTRPVEDIVESLSRRDWRDYCGTMEEKLLLYETVRENQKRFDIVFSYSEMVNQEIDRLNGWITQDAYNLKRRPRDVIKFNCDNSTWCRDNLRRQWGNGGIRKKGDKLKIENL